MAEGRRKPHGGVRVVPKGLEMFLKSISKPSTSRSARDPSSDEESNSDHEYYDSDPNEGLEDNDDDLLPKATANIRIAGHDEMKMPHNSKGSAFPLIADIKQLQALGLSRRLLQTDESYRTIGKYVNNCADADWDIELLNIYGLTGATPPPPRSLSGQNQLDLLLWCKTSPGSVKYLVEKSSNCSAYYDRIARAFAATPDELWRRSLTQIIVLCSVSIGKPLRSDQGYHYWKSKRPTNGSDSVLAEGRLQPDWEDSRELHSVLVPCGKTLSRKRDRRKAYLKYSEYIIFDARRATPVYAVEVRVTPNIVDSSDSSE